MEHKKVIAGMSGGVDSAVAALLLRQQGCDVAGVFMKNWDDSADGSDCPAEEDYADVRDVCARIGIPYYTVNFQREYWDRVFTYFLAEYKAGRTPNPDVLCNSEIKFAAFLDFARSSGADSIATGHYVQREDMDGVAYLKKGADEGKDQSYFLCMLSQQQLQGAVFPIGGMQKPQVREIAAEHGLSVAGKKDSTGICFIGERKFKDFLKTYLPANPGEIRTTEGHVAGRHDGLMYYTLGQRRGLDIGGRKGAEEGRWFVTGKDLESNTLVVSQDEGLLFSRALIMKDVSFISGNPGKGEFGVKVRYRQPDQQAQAHALEDGRWMVEFSHKQRAVTPGQYCVLYNGDICLGGGEVSEVIF